MKGKECAVWRLFLHLTALQCRALIRALEHDEGKHYAPAGGAGAAAPPPASSKEARMANPAQLYKIKHCYSAHNRSALIFAAARSKAVERK